MSSSLGSLKALQEVDFTETKGQLEQMGGFYNKMNEAMESMANTVDTLNQANDDVQAYKTNMSSLNANLNSLNSVYGNVLGAFRQPLS